MKSLETIKKMTKIMKKKKKTEKFFFPIVMQSNIARDKPIYMDIL